MPHVHTFSDNWTSNEESHWHTADCGDTDEVRGKEAHKFGEGKVKTEATVEAEGEKIYTCTVCGYEKKQVIEKHKHTFATDYSSDDDFHWYESTCGHKDAETKIEHSFDDVKVTKEATETEEGEKVYTCNFCGKVLTVKTGTSTHTHTYETSLSYDNEFHWYKPTCEHATEIKDKNKHTLVEAGTTVNATCTTDGYISDMM